MRNPSWPRAGSSSGGKTPCCSKIGIKRGPWTPEEDQILSNYVKREGEGRWRTLPKRAGLVRCGKSCRLRWMNYLRPSVKRGHITPDEEDLILRLHRLLGNRWALIAGRIPGRTDNEIKNYWNTHLSKKLISQGIDPRTHKPLQNLDPRPDDAVAASSSIPNHNQNPNPIVGAIEYSQRDDGAAASAIIDRANLRSHARCENWENYLENSGEDVLSSFLDSLMNDDAYVHRQQRENIAAAVAPPSPPPPMFPVPSSFNPSSSNRVTWGEAELGSAMDEFRPAEQWNTGHNSHA